MLRGISHQRRSYQQLELALLDSIDGVQRSFSFHEGIVLFDSSAAELTSTELHFLFIFHSFLDGLCGLVLESAHPYRWKRVGMFQIPGASPLDEEVQLLRLLPKTGIELN